MSFAFKRAEDSPGFLLWQVTIQWQREQRKALAKLGLTHAQFVVLASLLWLETHTETEVTQNHVSELSKIDKMSMSDLVKILIQKKLIRRTHHQQDKRAYALTLTPKGKKLVLKAIPIVEKIDTDFFTSQNSDLQQLIHVLGDLS